MSDPIIVTAIDEEWRDGTLVSSVQRQVDVTEQVVTLDLHGKARQAIDANVAFLALASPTNAQTLAQVQRLTKECTALIRLLIGADLLRDTTGTD